VGQTTRSTQQPAPRYRLRSHPRRLLHSALERDGALADYNVALSWLAHGELDEHRLRAAVQRLVAEQEGLRTVIRDAEYAVVQSASDFGWSALPDASVDDWTAVQDFLRTPFDFARGPMLRVGLQRRGDATLVILMSHHVMLDGTSAAYLDEAVWTYYAQGADPTAAADATEGRRPFRDFVAWQDAALAAGDFERDAVYWKSQLADVEDALRACHPLGANRDAEPDRFPVRHQAICLPDGARYSSRLDPTGTTCFVATLTAYGRALCRALRVDEVVVRTSVNTRPSDEFANTVGDFNNTILMRLPFGGDAPISSLVRQTRSASLDALEHSAMPYSAVADAANVPSGIGGIDAVPFTIAVLDEPQRPRRSVSPELDVEAVQLPHSGGITTPLILIATTSDAMVTSVDLLMGDGLFTARQLEQLEAEFISGLTELSGRSA
jgi:hypothetical protein